MLEDLNATDSEHILRACKEMGLNAVIVVDDGAAMLRDIEKRGWFINPLRRDDTESRRTKQ